MRVIDLFDRSAASFAERACLVDSQTTLTYRETQLKTFAYAAALARVGGARQTRVGVLAPNCVDAFVAVLSVFRAGCIWVPANSKATAAELAAFLALVKCQILLVHESLTELGLAAVSGTSCRVVGFNEFETEPQSDSQKFLSPSQAIDSMEICSVFSTGGTTGLSKAATWTHRTWATLTANFLAGIHYDKPPVHLVAAPLTHAAGVVSMPLVAIGATTVIIPRAEPEAVMQAIAQHKVTTLFLPPTVIYMMLAHPDVRKYDYSSLQNFIYAAAPMSESKLKLAMNVFGPVMVQTFGQAEAPMVCTILTRQDHIDALKANRQDLLTSCGRPALFTDLAIMDDDGAVLPTGETGEIVVRGDLVMAGYMNDAGATAASRLNGWHRTGDIGRQDAQGYVFITDRKRDMIISGGFNVYPSEIEQVIWTHPAVQDCAVIGAPDDKWGEAVVAVVELKKGATTDASTLVELCKSKLGSIKAPKSVVFWPELPRSGVGKVLKRKIRDHFWADRQRKI